MVEGVLDIGDEFGCEVQVWVGHGGEDGVDRSQRAGNLLSIGCAYGWEGQ